MATEVDTSLGAVVGSTSQRLGSATNPLTPTGGNTACRTQWYVCLTNSGTCDGL